MVSGEGGESAFGDWWECGLQALSMVAPAETLSDVGVDQKDILFDNTACMAGRDHDFDDTHSTLRSSCLLCILASAVQILEEMVHRWNCLGIAE